MTPERRGDRWQDYTEKAVSQYPEIPPRGPPDPPPGTPPQGVPVKLGPVPEDWDPGQEYVKYKWA